MFFNQDPLIKHHYKMLGDQSDQSHCDWIDIIRKILDSQNDLG